MSLFRFNITQSKCLKITCNLYFFFTCGANKVYPFLVARSRDILTKNQKIFEIRQRDVTTFPQGLRYIHSTDLVHLDIKPGNIFISLREVNKLFLSSELRDSAISIKQNFNKTIFYFHGKSIHISPINNKNTRILAS